MTFDEAVKEALILGRRDPLRIAQIALQVCKRGYRGISEDYPSYSRFSKSIGVSHACLCEWMALYRVAAEINSEDPLSVSPREARIMLKNNQLGAEDSGPWLNRMRNKQARVDALKHVGVYSYPFLSYAKKFKNQLLNQTSKDIPEGLKAEILKILKQTIEELSK